MKPRLLDYVIITLCLIAIFACGLVVGHLRGERQGRQAGPPATAPEHQSPWQQRTLEKLTSSLDLSPDQRKQVAAEVEKSAVEIHTNRQRAIEAHYRQILDLHQRIYPHLRPDQAAKLKNDEEKLQLLLDSRFPSN